MYGTTSTVNQLCTQDMSLGSHLNVHAVSFEPHRGQRSMPSMPMGMEGYTGENMTFKSSPPIQISSPRVCGGAVQMVSYGNVNGMQGECYYGIESPSTLIAATVSSPSNSSVLDGSSLSGSYVDRFALPASGAFSPATSAPSSPKLCSLAPAFTSQPPHTLQEACLVGSAAHAVSPNFFASELEAWGNAHRSKGAARDGVDYVCGLSNVCSYLS